MKFKWSDKLVLLLCAVVVLFVGAGLILLGCQLSAIELSGEGEGFFTWQRLVVFGAGLLTVLSAVYMFLLPRKLKDNRKGFVIQQTENGELRISIKAIENLVQKCIDMHEEINVVSMGIHNTRDGVMIDLKISLSNNISIPLAVASLQKQIKQYLLVSSGIDAHEVRVSVETTENKAIAESPYRVDETPIEDNKESFSLPQAKNEKKKPLYQRIFGHEEQPAVVPNKPETAVETSGEPAAPFFEPEKPKEQPAAEALAPKSAQEEQAPKADWAERGDVGTADEEVKA